MSPASAPIDAPVQVSLDGVPAGAHVDLRAEEADKDGNPWRAHAQFVANGQGHVGLDQPSTGGSYTGVNPMGLFELMTPVHTAASPTLRVATDRNSTVTLTARVNGDVVARASTVRMNPLVNGVTEHPQRLQQTGIYGEMFLPKDTATKRPAILLIGGSEGGLPPALPAAVLAGNGFPTLALAYFGEPGLPQSLRDIPVEYFAKALALLAAQPGVNASRLVAWGVSRGSEAALLAGIHYPNLVAAVIAGSPSSVMNGSYPPGGAAWTLNGKPLPYPPDQDYGQPHPTDAPAAELAVEKIHGPVVTICGELDNVWPSCPYSQAIAARRAAHQVPYADLSLRYPTAGHIVGAAICYNSTTTTAGRTSIGDTVELGGIIQDNATASADAHTKVLTFLHGL